MRVRIRITVTGKMLGAGKHAVVLHTLHILVAFDGDIVNIFSERAVINHGIERIVVHIGNGRKV